MKPISRLFFLVYLVLAFLLPPRVCQASTDDFSLLMDDDAMSFDSFSAQSGPHRWQLSLAPAYAFLSDSHYDSINFSNGVAFDGSLYYRLNPWWQFGVEGGYSFNHEHSQDLFTIDGYTFTLQDRLDIVHVTPSIEVGSWQKGIKPWRIYANAGAGWYQINEKHDFKLDANQFLFSEQLNDRTDDYLGAQGGVGVECEIYPQGVIGIQMTYRRIFAPGGNLTILAPTLRFSYLY